MTNDAKLKQTKDKLDKLRDAIMVVAKNQRDVEYNRGITISFDTLSPIVLELVQALKTIALENIYVAENGWRDEHFLNVKQANEALSNFDKFLEGKK